MKKIFVLIFCFCFLCVGCSKQTSENVVAEKQADATNIDLLVSKEIESIEGVDSFSDETIKSLSVVTRTNLLNQSNLSIEPYTPKNQHIYNLVKETENQILENETENAQNKIKIKNAEEEIWVKEIKKVEILKFLTKNQISLANTSNIKPQKNEFGKTTNLNIGGKNISFEKIMNEFNLPSDNIENIENNKTYIKIYGKGTKNSLIFNIKEAENLSKQGFSYEKILKNSQNNFQIITRK